MSALGWRTELGTEGLDPDRVHSAFFVINMMDHHAVVGKGILLEKFPPPMSGVRGPHRSLRTPCRTETKPGPISQAMFAVKMPCYLGKCTK